MKWMCAVLVALVVQGGIGGAHAVEVRDDLGEVFNFKTVPQRLVSLAPSNTELL